MADKGGSKMGWEAPRWVRTGAMVLGALVVVAVLVFALRPQPVPVDLATVDRGEIEVVVDEDGRTQVRDRYRITAPVAGTLRRVTLEPGDEVAEGDPVVWLDGPEVGVTDSRTRAQLQTRIAAAEAGVGRAEAMVEAAEAGLVEARDQLRRQEILLEQSGGSTSAVERARAMLRAREAEVRSAEFSVRAAEGEVEDLRLALARPGGAAGGAAEAPLELRSPVAGRVLQVHRESAGAVAPGELILEVGDPGRLEVVVDLLSGDAVRVVPGAEAVIRRWGGDEDLPAVVRRVDPSGFTRVSALGIEEQRVNVILDPEGASELWARLGDGFRVEARIRIDRTDSVLRVPSGALFRNDEGWAVFLAGDGRIEERNVEVGRRSPAMAEVVSGVDEGDRVVVFPGDRVEAGVRYRER
ncbi:MAG: HlyD family efflux transporter periplasmic adaptor subunit [Gemmatimonadales bacterium]|nr:MAG: HlyD family efflux transporter periplasmic adaptor subunit [Gemmatimonadales bacterium]